MVISLVMKADTREILLSGMNRFKFSDERKTFRTITVIMDTHKTDAELSVLSSGDEVCHRLPEKSRLTSVLSEVVSTIIMSARLIAMYYP